jgi:8-hydroxy-5-deazaflavin:NADPH oxidoreductase
VCARAFNSLGWENLADPDFDGTQADLLWCGPDGDPGALVERLITDVGLRPVRVGGLDQLSTVDMLASLWFALALGQGHGRHLAFKVLTR